jgi:hypothetical protein
MRVAGALEFIEEESRETRRDPQDACGHLQGE